MLLSARFVMCRGAVHVLGLIRIWPTDVIHKRRTINTIGIIHNFVVSRDGRTSQLEQILYCLAMCVTYLPKKLLFHFKLKLRAFLEYWKTWEASRAKNNKQQSCHCQKYLKFQEAKILSLNFLLPKGCSIWSMQLFLLSKYEIGMIELSVKFVPWIKIWLRSKNPV